MYQAAAYAASPAEQCGTLTLLNGSTMTPRSLSSPLRLSIAAAARRELDTMVRRLVPEAADFCLVHVVSRGTIRAVTWAHSRPEGDRLLRALTRRYRISPNDGASGVASVLRTQRPLLRTAIQIDVAVARRGDAAAAEIHRQLAPRSALVVPIATSAGILGALTLCFSQSGRTYSARHVPAAVKIAIRMARTLVPEDTPGRGITGAGAAMERTASKARRRALPRS